ncbi:hypothetical protein TCDM_12641 [Trypanosoma cruzi Dm28c]|uniref:Uncharacterized protein n=1 Tax=Trypanosoma cruzi Dm28c TaxID=1416333 RepID=V5AKT2_TRYCR|nr:hypothetical protein TCDM_12641 [Trypanosoma cruzi Dm28c]
MVKTNASFCCGDIAQPSAWVEKEGKSADRPPERKRDSAAVSYLTQTLRGQCPVSCAESARRLWAHHCATRCDSSEHNSRHVPFRSHSWWCGIHCLAACWWRRLRFCRVIEDARHERCWAGWARPSAAIVPTSPTQTRPQQQTQKKDLPLRATSSCVMVRHFRAIPPHAVQHFHRGEPRRTLNASFISAECSSCQHQLQEEHQAALQHVRRAFVCLQTRKEKKSCAREETKKTAAEVQERRREKKEGSQSSRWHGSPKCGNSQYACRNKK